ncbi:MAG TPA: cobyrinate a,c-diamide synthase [Burkholderiaceae bacterium]|nr:cobyrinate a,c-diamide synthase [Burkholderiaceae bacterium]
MTRRAAGQRTCPAVLIAAPASGQGKTTVTAGLARALRDAGHRVRVFKVGPDFLDPMILERASGAPVHQLDLWMCGEAQCRALLHDAAAQADVILVEGVMGLFDGKPSSADLARRFGLPLLVVVDASAMAQTFGAIVYGLATLDPSLRCIGAVANRVAGDGHAAMLRESMPAGLPLLAALPLRAQAALPDRYLGLHQPHEIADLESRLQALAGDDWRAPADDLLAVLRPSAASFEAPQPAASAALLHRRRIAVARDAAFSFIYPANLDALRALGATIEFFSPLDDDALPPADAVWLPGGYPELHARRLEDNLRMREQLRAFCAAGRPLLAECGGLMVLLERMTDASGQQFAMAGVLPGAVWMQDTVAAIASQQVELPEGTLRGHTFHHSRMSTPVQPIARGRCPAGGRTAEPVYRHGAITASYVHFYFPSNPAAVAAILGS